MNKINEPGDGMQGGATAVMGGGSAADSAPGSSGDRSWSADDAAEKGKQMAGAAGKHMQEHVRSVMHDVECFVRNNPKTAIVGSWMIGHAMAWACRRRR